MTSIIMLPLAAPRESISALKDNEALIIENRVKRQPHYSAFQMSKLWVDSLEYAYLTGSRNGNHVAFDQDVVLRTVVVHCVPGVSNWSDTSLHRKGFLTPPYFYSPRPEEGIGGMSGGAAKK